MWTVPPASILVPVDFGDASGRAVEVAAALAVRLGAALQVLHAEALEAPAYFTRDQIRLLEREQAAARARADEFLTGFAHDHGAGDFTTAVVDGPPTPAILKAAAGVDLVVMGTHGRRGPARWWLGSVAERVVHESPVPVLIVRAGAEAPPLSVFERPVVFAGLPSAERAVAAANAIGQATGGEVVSLDAACAPERAAEARATLVIVPTAGPSVRLPHDAERWLRNCSLPMLFVPAADSAR